MAPKMVELYKITEFLVKGKGVIIYENLRIGPLERRYWIYDTIEDVWNGPLEGHIAEEVLMKTQKSLSRDSSFPENLG